MNESTARRVFRFRDAVLSYDRQGSGPPVVCLHNGGTSSTIWRHVIAALSPTREVFAVDLAGFGASTEPASGLSLQGHVEALKSLFDANALGPVDLVGNCMGSAIALLLAHRFPESVRRLVLFNPLSEATFRAGKFGAFHWVERHAALALDALERGVGRTPLPPSVARVLLRTHFGDAGLRAGLPADEHLVACYTRPTQLLALRALLSDIASYAAIDHLSWHGDLPPACIVWGEQNVILSAEAGRVLNDKLRPRRQGWLPDCGHLPMLERPESCLDVMIPFLEEPMRDGERSLA